MYDIYLSSNCRQAPDLSAFQNVATLTSKQSRLFEAEPAGFLGLSLSGDRAGELIEQLLLADGYGYVVPVAYRQPLVTREMARPIAEQVIAQKQKKHFPAYTFEPVQFWREEGMTWVFGAASKELGESGHIPGAVSTHIDKLDGHVWSRQELGSLHLHGEEYYLNTATTLSPQHLLHILASQLGLEWGVDYKHHNQTCLKGPATVVRAVKHSYPVFVENFYGFRPTVQLYFRLIPYKTGYDSAVPLLLQAVMKVLRHDSRDAVLTFDEGIPVILIEQRSGQLILGAGWDKWVRSQPVSRRSLISVIWGQEISEQWDAQFAVNQPKEAQSRSLELVIA